MCRFTSLVVPVAVAAWGATLVGVSDVNAQPARGGSVVLGQGAGSSKQDRAKEHFDTAREHYANGRYREAIEELEAALVLDPGGADLVYNLGVINEKLQEVDNAILYYRRYIDMIDDAEEQQRVTKIVLRLEKARDELAAAKAKEEQEATAAQDEPQRDAGAAEKGRMDGWVIGAGALAVVGLAGGTYFGLQALSNKEDNPETRPNGPTYQDLEDDADKAHQQAVFADIGFGVAVAAGATAAILYFARDAEPDEPEAEAKGVSWEPGVAVLPNGAAASLRLGF